MNSGPKHPEREGGKGGEWESHVGEADELSSARLHRVGLASQNPLALKAQKPVSQHKEIVYLDQSHFNQAPRLMYGIRIPVNLEGEFKPPEEGMATHSSIFAWRIPWTEKPGIVHRVTKRQTQMQRLSTHART